MGRGWSDVRKNQRAALFDLLASGTYTKPQIASRLAMSDRHVNRAIGDVRDFVSEVGGGALVCAPPPDFDGPWRYAVVSEWDDAKLWMEMMRKMILGSIKTSRSQVAGLMPLAEGRRKVRLEQAEMYLRHAEEIVAAMNG